MPAIKKEITPQPWKKSMREVGVRHPPNNFFQTGILDFFDNVRDDRTASTTAMRNAARVIVDDVANSAVFADPAARIPLEAPFALWPA